MCHPINRTKHQLRIQSYQQIQQGGDQSNDVATQATQGGNVILFPSRTVTLPTSQTMQSDFVPPNDLIAEIDDGMTTSLMEEEENRKQCQKHTWKHRELILYRWKLRSFFMNRGQYRKSDHIFLLYGFFLFVTYTIVKTTM